MLDKEKFFDQELDYSFHTHKTPNRKLEKTYQHIREIETYLVQYSMRLQAHAVTDDEKARAGEFTYVIMQVVQSSKMLKDIYHNIQEVVLNDSPELKEQAILFTSRVRNLYTDSMNIIREHNSNKDYERLLDMFIYVKKEDRKYTQELQKIIQEGDIPSDDISNIIRVNRYIYNSSKSMLIAIRDLLLTKDRRESLDREVHKKIKSIASLRDKKDT